MPKLEQYYIRDPRRRNPRIEGAMSAWELENEPVLLFKTRTELPTQSARFLADPNGPFNAASALLLKYEDESTVKIMMND